jgi:hypothetical protein
MGPAAAEAGVAEGYEALAVGNWDAARAAFETALAVEEFPEALDGLGRALWWLRESESLLPQCGQRRRCRRHGRPERPAPARLHHSRHRSQPR